MPTNINLANLTPPTVANTNTAPRLWTKSEYRDGTRPSPGGGGEVNWTARLARTGSGTPDAGFNPRTDITYVGAFRIPYFENGSGQYANVASMVYCPPDGRNGVNGSVFLAGNIYMAEVQIPTLIADTTDHAILNAGTVLQTWTNIFAKTTGSPEPSGSAATHWVGWMKFVGGKLHTSWYADYSTATNTSNYAIIDDHTDLANTTVFGLKNISYADKGVRYCSVIPSDKVSLFNNNTHFSGICSSLSIVGRSSFGHSFFGFNPEAITNEQTTIAASQYSYYPGNTPHYWYSTSNEFITAHYSSEIGVSVGDYVMLDSYSRQPELYSFAGLAMPDESIRRPAIGETTNCGCAFIPSGTNTVCFIGYNVGMRYGIGYKKRYIEQLGVDELWGKSGWHPWSRNDFDNVFWTMNLNDIANSIDDRPDYIEFGLFEQDPWKPLFDYERAGLIISGDYDPDTGRLYLLQMRVPQNQFNTQYIVSVYQVG